MTTTISTTATHLAAPAATTMATSLTTDIELVNAAETAALLYQHLGPLREWSDLLGDARNGRGGLIYGLTLLPYCRIRDDRMMRPAYQMSDVLTFVGAVLAADPYRRPLPVGIVGRTLKVERGDARHWRLRKYDAKGGALASPALTTTYSVTALH